MKLSVGLICIALALNVALALPAGNPNDDVEVITTPGKSGGGSERAAGAAGAAGGAGAGADSASDENDFNDFKGIIDTGSGYPFLQPNPHAFSFNLGFFDSFEDIFRRLRTRLWPSELGGAGGDDSDEVNLGFSPVNVNLKDGNTTSTVKVVDGHKIEVNETVYGDQNNVFRVRVVNVRPLASGEEVEEGVLRSDGTNNFNAPTTSAPLPGANSHDVANDSDERREPLEKKPADNEVATNNDEAERLKYDLTLPAATEPATTEDNTAFVTDNSSLEDLVEHTEYPVSFEIGSGDDSDSDSDSNSESIHIEAESNKQLDSNEDDDSMAEFGITVSAEQLGESEEQPSVAISKLLASEGLTIERNEETEANEDDERDAVKERENFESSDDESNIDESNMPDGYNEEWGDLGKDENNDLSNDIDVYDAVPVDLSNDIEVNEWAAAQPNFKPNPDAEFIHVDSATGAVTPATMAKFEKLSMAPMTSNPSSPAENMK